MARQNAARSCDRQANFLKKRIYSAVLFRGRFAQLDPSARRWPFAHPVSLASDRGLVAASRTKKTWMPICRAEET
jgi:hypothetical protein